MNQRPPLSALTPDQLMERAREYRRMAAAATTAQTRDALNALAVPFATLAAHRCRRHADQARRGRSVIGSKDATANPQGASRGPGHPGDIARAPMCALCGTQPPETGDGHARTTVRHQPQLG
jgi:hypothetical protein